MTTTVPIEWSFASAPADEAGDSRDHTERP